MGDSLWVFLSAWFTWSQVARILFGVRLKVIVRVLGVRFDKIKENVYLKTGHTRTRSASPERLLGVSSGILVVSDESNQIDRKRAVPAPQRGCPLPEL